MISTDEAGKIQGVGAHRFKTTNHGGQPCLYVIEGEDLNGSFINTPCPGRNGVNIPLSVGTHRYTIYAQNANSYSWNNYALNLHFANSNAAQVSVVAPLNSTSTQFFPPSRPNGEFTDDLQGQSVKAPNTLEYKSGQTLVRVSSFHISNPTLFNKDRIGPFEARPDGTPDYVAQFTIEVEAPPQISAGGVVNSASFEPKLVPGSLISIFGSDLSTARQEAAAVPLPTSLAGASVTIAGKPAPLVFVSPTQINAQVPYDIPVGAETTVAVNVNGKASPSSQVRVVSQAPGVFQFGEKRAVVQNSDNTVNMTNNGAEAESWVIAYATGGGEVDNPVPTGSAAPLSPLARHKGNVTATINGTMAEVAFAGLTPQYIGLTQVNFKVPRLAAGTYPLVISVNGEASNQAMITVK
jgi:uncharacterized protein (TIGR03437 family)